MKIGVLTSNEHRHRYFANYLAHRLPVKIVVAEPKTASPRDVGRSQEEGQLLAQYFHEREEAEKAILEGGEGFDVPSGVKLLETLPGKINTPEVVKALLDQGVDTLAVFGTGLLKEPLLRPFQGRIVNIHLGISPYYRGSATIFWALYNEDLDLAGSTIHYIDAGVDTGDIICHVQAPIELNDTPHTIGNKVIKESVCTLVAVIRELGKGPVPAVPQWKPKNEHVYRRRDFNTEILQDLMDRWDRGLVRRFLESRANGRREMVRLLPVPETFVSGDAMFPTRS